MKQILLGLAGVACCVVGIVAQAKINKPAVLPKDLPSWISPRRIQSPSTIS